MDTFESKLNEKLVRVYRAVEILESLMLRAEDGFDLTISEIHLLEAVAAASPEKATISDISDFLDISLPSVTSAVNKLVRKGYVEKERCIEDGRVVRVGLTRQGRRAEHAHRYFHRSMARSVAREMTEDEKTALLRGVEILDAFLEKNNAKYREMT